jgi:hypothetical protein
MNLPSSKRRMIVEQLTTLDVLLQKITGQAFHCLPHFCVRRNYFSAETPSGSPEPDQEDRKVKAGNLPCTGYAL